MKRNDQEEYVPKWLKRIEKNRKIVKDFLASLDDNTLIKTAYLFMQGYSDDKVMRELDLDETALKQVKNQLAVGLKLAGIETRA
ncbi:MAG: hypothetical protein IKJ37_07435 [Kiritimatiellae bacterium]|nr:hypothetical protein [Kiritimatiellia bacterium]